mgnify:CR=1 FL=1
MEYKNKIGFFKRIALGAVASVAALGWLYCSPDDLQRRVNNLEQQVSQLTQIQNFDSYFVNGFEIKGNPHGGQDSGNIVVVEVSPEDVGVNCVNGGYRIDFYRDDNNDGVKQDTEATLLGTAYSCTGDTGPQGSIGQQGEQGIEGRSLVTLINQESPGINCSNGGYRIDFYRDDNNDGVKQENETTLIGTSYSCDGSNSIDPCLSDITPPEVSFVALPRKGAVPLEATFIGFANDPECGIESYSWDFNNDGIEDSTNGTDIFTFDQSGNFNSKLRVTNRAGLSTEFSGTNVNGLEIIVGPPIIPPPVGIIFVKRDAAGLNDGDSWENAYTNLQIALARATNNLNTVNEIWVAAGTYKPGAIDERASTFHLITGIGIYGGFAGSESGKESRNPRNHITVLSGDLRGDDDSINFLNYGDNSFHVGTGSDTSKSAILDGFTISGGNGIEGPGIININGAPTIRDCIFIYNLAGAVGGAGMYNNNSHPDVINSKFVFNRATDGAGGGMLNHNGSEPYLVNCAFIENQVGPGVSGGGMSNDQSNPTLINNTFIRNHSGTTGGRGLFNNTGSVATLSNCIFWDNNGSDENTQISSINASSASINISCIQGWTGSLGGVGNNGEDPLFEDLEGRLSINSPSKDTGSNKVVPDGITTDLDGNPRIVNGNVDRGAYEVQE